VIAGPATTPLTSASRSGVDLFTDKDDGVAGAYERDYVDTAAALERDSVDQVIGFARRLEPGLDDWDFADAGRRLDQMDDEAFVQYGLGPQDAARLRERFAAWPRT
jgi:hypothetical protein